MFGERAGARTQDLQIKSYLGAPKSACASTAEVSKREPHKPGCAEERGRGLETDPRPLLLPRHPLPAWCAAPAQPAYERHGVTTERLERLFQQVQWIFNRGAAGWGPRDLGYAFMPLAKAYVLRNLAARLVRIPGVHCTAAVAGGVRSHGRESREHALLKRSALLWAKSIGAADAEEEQWCAVGKADVYSDERAWIIECGNTPIAKLVDAVGSERQPRFTLVPYQRCPGTLPVSASLIAIDFVWSPALTAELRAAARQRADEVRSAMDRAYLQMGLTAAVERRLARDAEAPASAPAQGGVR